MKTLLTISCPQGIDTDVHKVTSYVQYYQDSRLFCCFAQTINNKSLKEIAQPPSSTSTWFSHTMTLNVRKQVFHFVNECK